MKENTNEKTGGEHGKLQPQVRCCKTCKYWHCFEIGDLMVDDESYPSFGTCQWHEIDVESRNDALCEHYSPNK